MSRPRPVFSASKDYPFLPEVEVEGYRGYYPARADIFPANEADRIPLPLECFTVLNNDILHFKCCIRFSATHYNDEKPTFNSFIAQLRPGELLKQLFCQTGVSVEILTVVWRDGKETWASWRQDTRTGAYKIVGGANGDSDLVIQGGFLGHMPANVYWYDAWNNWAIDSMKPGCGRW